MSCLTTTYKASQGSFTNRHHVFHPTNHISITSWKHFSNAKLIARRSIFPPGTQNENVSLEINMMLLSCKQFSALSVPLFSLLRSVAWCEIPVTTAAAAAAKNERFILNIIIFHLLINVLWARLLLHVHHAIMRRWLHHVGIHRIN